MKKQILFVQGGGPDAHDAWDNKLVDSLRRELGSGYVVKYPRMPNEGDPKYADWKVALKEEIEQLEDDAILVGHSIGGTILINFLAEAPPNRLINGVFLISAPFIGPGGWPSDEILPMTQLGVLLLPNIPIYLYHGSEDETAPLVHVDLYEKAIPGANIRRLFGRDHQLYNDLAEVAADIRYL